MFLLIKLIGNSHLTNWFGFVDGHQSANDARDSLDHLRSNADMLTTLSSQIRNECPELAPPVSRIAVALRNAIELQTDASFRQLHDSMLSEMPKLGGPILEYMLRQLDGLIAAVAASNPSRGSDATSGPNGITWRTVLMDKRVAAAELLAAVLRQASGATPAILPLDIGTRIVWNGGEPRLVISSRCPQCRKYHQNRAGGRPWLTRWREVDVSFFSDATISDWLDRWRLEHGQIFYAERCADCAQAPDSGVRSCAPRG
jgi:hypothetical protein